MRAFDRVIVTFFCLFAFAALAVGAGTLFYAFDTIEPALERVEKNVVEDLAMAEDTVQVVERHRRLIEEADAPAKSAVDAVGAVPDTLADTATSLRSTVALLGATANTMREIGDSTGLVLSSQVFDENAAALDAAADELQSLPGRLDTLAASNRTLAGDLERSVEDMARLQANLVKSDVTLQRVQSRLAKTREAIDRADLPTEIARRTGLTGGLYIVIAVVLFGMAGIWKRLSELAIRTARRGEAHG